MIFKTLFKGFQTLVKFFSTLLPWSRVKTATFRRLPAQHVRRRAPAPRGKKTWNLMNLTQAPREVWFKLRKKDTAGKRNVSRLDKVRSNCAVDRQTSHFLNPRPAGVFSRAPLGGGGADSAPPPCLTPELIGAARRARRRSKALNGKIPMHIKNFL